MSRTLLILTIARVAHEANRAFAYANGELMPPPWDYAPRWQQDSAIAGVTAVLDGKATTPEETHESWSQQKLADGWVYGLVKDAEAKTHPCLVPYDQLPPHQQQKDALFLAVVGALR